jgi:mono/diheme cytochrome c family protein
VKKLVFLVVVLAWAGASVGVVGQNSARPQGPAAVPSTPAEYKALVDTYCVTCHNQRANIPSGAPLYLDAVDVNDLAKDAEVWEKVVRKLGVGAMPPQGSRHPGQPALDGLVSFITTSLDRAAAAANNPGSYQLHRLNRTEYQNAIRDLLDLEVDVTGLLPPDSSDFGFDNIASVLKVTPALLERYLTAAVRVSALAVGDPGAETTEEKFPVRLDVTQNARVDGLPIGTRGGTMVRYNFPADGEYLLAGFLFRPVDNADSGIEGQEVPHEFQILVDGEVAHSALIGGPTDHTASRANLTAVREIVEQRMRVRTRVTAGEHEIGFTFVERPARSQDIFRPPLRGSQDIHVGSEPPKLTRATITGPFEADGVSASPSRRRIFVCRPAAAAEEAPCARRILSTIARRAYRRPVSDADMAPILAFYEQGRRGADFDAGIRAALPRILASPSFLFRSESDPAALAVGTAHPVSDLELASRLSFFLWSSIPDDELLDLAIQNRLRASGVIERQVRRMLADPRSDALSKNFPDQWLALRNLATVAPDLIGFPDFDDNLRQAFMRETELLFRAVVREDRSTLDLLNADYTFLNERLARHYGVPGIYGTEFRRVTVTDERRRGLLGHGSILTLTSVATRTSPVFRGKWILTNFLNVPPLPPPANIANVLAPEEQGAAPKSVRERLENHRRNPVCASCHRSMDPIGFALEPFDAVGKWRAKTEDGAPVDASGVLVDGTPVDGPVALRRALLSRPSVFVGTVTEKLLTYALGRGLEPYDMPVVRKVVADAAGNNYRMVSIITGIVESRPFQNRRKVAEADTE